jgi:tetratricopeptide (TPR) repeat protein
MSVRSFLSVSTYGDFCGLVALSNVLKTFVVTSSIGVLSYPTASAFGAPVADDPLPEIEKALTNGDFMSARGLLAKALKDNPDDAKLLLLALRTSRRAEAFEEVDKYLAQCDRQKIHSDAVELERKLLRIQKGEVDEAKELTDLAKNNPKHASLIFEAVTRGYLRVFQRKAALNYVAVWLEQQPDDAQALFQLGVIEDGAKSIRAYRGVLEIVPGHVEARRRLGAALLAQNQPQKARDEFLLLQKTQPQDPAVLVGLAECEYGLGKMAEARALLDEALKIDGKNVAALRERGRLDLAVGEPAKAEAWLQKAVAIEPGDVISLYSLALCSQQLGKEDEFKQRTEKHREVTADSELLAELFEDLGRTLDDTVTYTRAGAVLLRLGRDDEGIRCCHLALKLDDKHRPAHAILAEYYERVGKKELAEAHRKLAKPMEK